MPHFPNLFVLYGPNTNIVINGSIIFFSGARCGYLTECVRPCWRSRRALDCRPEVHGAFNRRVDGQRPDGGSHVR